MKEYGTIFENLSFLVVEDEYLVAEDICASIREAGGDVKGPCADAAAACEMLAGAEKMPDAAVLDLNLKGKSVGRVARLLEERHIPFLYYSGYEEVDLGQDLPKAPLVRKPLTAAALQKHLAAVVKPRLDKR